MPKTADPTVADRLVLAAARILGTEGRDAVSARRLAREVGASTMVVYTHFGGMDEVLLAVRREGFRRFGEAIGAPALTEDPVADWMVQAWAYRRFALDERHLWTVIFRDSGDGLDGVTEQDAIAAYATFQALELRVRRCTGAGRWAIEDVMLASEVCWSQVHGIAGVELSGWFDGTRRDAGRALETALKGTSIGFGDARDLATASTVSARRRAERSGLV